MSTVRQDHTNRVAMGIPGLDDILFGGLPRNRLYLIQGDPGSGKTTIGLQYLLEGAKRNEPGLYVTLSETDEELRAVANSHGWSLDGITFHELSRATERLSEEAMNTLFHSSEVELSEAVQPVLELVEKTKPVRVVFDSLSEMRLLAGDALRYRRQILALKQFFTGRHCTVLLIDDRTSEVGDLQLQSLAHGVISLEQVAPEYGSERRRLRIVKMRGSKFKGGFHDFRLRTGGVEVFPRMVAAEHRQEVAHTAMASGIQELDHLLGGGLDRGTSTLFMGPPGSGKSSLAVQYATSAARQGEHAAMFLFDEGRETCINRAMAMGMDIPRHIQEEKIALRQIDPAEVSPGEFSHLVRHSVEHDKARVVVIDSLNGYLNAMPEEKFLTTQMHELLSYLSQQGVITIMVLAQHGVLGDALSNPVDISYLADTAVLLRYFESQGVVCQAISVLKKRSGSHERTIREFKLESSGIRLGQPLTEFYGVLTGTPTFRGAQAELMRGANGKRPA